jgi:outer membrane protein OmpA-like peptidoglycan-associated protein
MKKIKTGMIMIAMAAFLFAGCSSLSKTQKGAAAGTVAGGAAGAVIGKATGNTALGAIIGAAVGGTAGAIIGHQMDKQAEEIKEAVPDAQVVRVGEGIVVEFSSGVLFAFDRFNLSNEAKTSLNKLVKVLNAYPDTDIEVQGHTDSSGSAAYNQTLSEQRASVVAAYLVDKGITNSRLTVIGFGEYLPKYLNDTEEGRAQNRRVEFLITANEKMRAEAEQQSGK